jgi:hypothetical protein
LTDTVDVLQQVTFIRQMQGAAMQLLEALMRRLPDKILPALKQSGDDVAAAARAGRATDIAALVVSAAAGVYDATGDPVHAVAEDVRSLAGVLRAATRRSVVPLEDTLEELGEEVANTLEDTVDTCIVLLDAGSSAAPDEGADAAAGAQQRESLAEAREQLREHQAIDSESYIQEAAQAQLARGVRRLGDKDAASTQQLVALEALAHRLIANDVRCAVWYTGPSCSEAQGVDVLSVAIMLLMLHLSEIVNVIAKRHKV